MDFAMIAKKNFLYGAILIVITGVIICWGYPAMGQSLDLPLDPLEEELLEAVPDSKEIQDTEPGKGSIEILSKSERDDIRISLDLKGMEINGLFRMLAQKTGLTIVTSKGLSGRINIFLNNISFQDALDTILITQNLACKRKGDIIYIMSATEYKYLYGHNYLETKEHRSIKLRFADPANVFTVISQLKSDVGKVIVDKASGMVILIDIPERVAIMEEMVRKLDTPLETVVFELNSAKPEDIKKSLAEVITPGTGTIIMDIKSSKVIVEDLPDKMEKIKQIVKNFDVAEKEVFIEAEIVQVNLNDRFQRGVNWSRVFGRVKDAATLESSFPVSSALAASGKMSIGTLEVDDYSVVLECLQVYGDIKILSSPKLAVMNNQEAKILVGTREVYVTQTLSQAETTTVTSEGLEFVDVGVKLKVTPTINNDGFVSMQIRPEVSNVAETITTSLGSRIPIVETSEVETVVTVKDNTMIMIAGLRKEEKRDEKEGIPRLSKLPIIGKLFGSSSKVNRQTELIVFITPHIITGEHTITKEPGNTKVIIGSDSLDDSDDAFLQELEQSQSFSDEVETDDEFLKELESMRGISELEPEISDSEEVDFDAKLKGIE